MQEAAFRVIWSCSKVSPHNKTNRYLNSRWLSNLLFAAGAEVMLGIYHIEGTFSSIKWKKKISVWFFCSLCAINWYHVSEDKMFASSSPKIPPRQHDCYQCRRVNSERAAFGLSPPDGTGMDSAACASFASLREFYPKNILQICTIRSEEHHSEICGKQISIRSKDVVLDATWLRPGDGELVLQFQLK